MKRAPNEVDAAVEPETLAAGGEVEVPAESLVQVRFIEPSPPYVVGQLLELPEKTAKRLIRAGTAVKDKSA